ncbi:MAG: CTP synthase [bacterium]
MTKYIFVTGGVVSSLGKGIASASIGRLLESRGLKVTIAKFDPYLNVDPGTMSPYQHGEVFVLEDGSETDLDLGHYERFLSGRLARNSSVTSGKIYNAVITKERKGDYLGKTVQVVPHITNEIKECILKITQGQKIDVCIVEVGGTVGDIESLPFLEAIRQFKFDVGKDNSLNIHVTLVPYIAASGELKTKPTQKTVSELRGIGIQADIILCRTARPLSEELKSKISLFCNVEPQAVFEALDANSIYEVPLLFKENELDEYLVKKLRLKARRQANLGQWGRFVQQVYAPRTEVEIAIAGKYVELHDAYKSIIESFIHAGVPNQAKVKLRWVDSEEVERRGAAALLKGVSGVLVPGGFGDRGIEGKIEVIRHAREKKMPFFGICLGMQCAVIEFARNVLGLKQANSGEFNPKTPDEVISMMEDQLKIQGLGGTMRLGGYPCKVEKGTKAFQAYQQNLINERHRHRYEFNNAYRDRIKAKGMKLCGLSPDGNLVEMIELANHPWFVGVQFHPELKSRPLNPHPLFREFVKAAVHYGHKKIKSKASKKKG